MVCNWDSLLRILPQWIGTQTDRLGKDTLQEIHLRLDEPPELVFSGKSWFLTGAVREADIAFSINSASHYSPWSVESCAEGYISLPGGHRMGLCGQTVVREGIVTGFRRVDSLCIRVARDLDGLAPPECAEFGSTLILGAPGWGKTTLLRCIAREIGKNREICVVDERQELFPDGFRRGTRMDVLSGCGKAFGIQMVLRSMGPDCIAVDEITSEEDARVLLHAAGCGVTLLATAHAWGKEDLIARPCYRRLLDAGVFQTVVILKKDKSFHWERMEAWSTNG